MTELRPHQVKARQQILDAWAAGERPMLAAPCSFGKTILAATMMKELAEQGYTCVFYCDRLRLLSQTTDTFDRLGCDYSVLQGNDWRFDPSKKIHIVSIQTAVRRRTIPFDYCFIDEAHTLYGGIRKMMENWDAVKICGLSATPMSKGLGKYFNRLLVPITPRELIAEGYLTPTEYYVGRSVDVSNVKLRALATGGTDYDPQDLARAIEADKLLSGDVVENYLAHAKGKKAMCFTPSIAHSKELVNKFNQEAGVRAVHIDGYMDTEEREVIYSGLKAGLYDIISCSRLLGVGFDQTDIECLIMCQPTKSLIWYVQTWGRGVRTHPGKEKLIYLDHSGCLQRIGRFPEDIVPTSMDDGSKAFRERSQVKEPDQKDQKKPQICPQCTSAFLGIRCACGYCIPVTKKLYTDSQILQKMESDTGKMQQFYSELLHIAQVKNYRTGWAAYRFKSRWNVWPPRSLHRTPAQPSQETINYLKHLAIKDRYARQHFESARKTT